MKLRTARALDGLLWLRAGATLVMRYPLQHLAMMSVMLFTVSLLMAVPLIGPALALAALPAFTAGWVFSSHAAGLGMAPGPARLFAVFRALRRPAFATLGALYAASALVVMAIAEQLNPGVGDQWLLVVSGKASEEAAAAALQAVQSGMVMRVAMLLPVVLFFWHAPVILMRTADSLPKALFASALASLRNLGAFFVYGVAWLLADVTLSSVMGVLLGALGLGPYAVLVALPMALLLSAAFYASLHASVEGCLVIEPPARPDDPAQPADPSAPT